MSPPGRSTQGEPSDEWVEEVTVEVTIQRVDDSPHEFRYDYSPVALPPAVTAAFDEFLAHRFGTQAADHAIRRVPTLEDLPEEARGPGWTAATEDGSG